MMNPYDSPYLVFAARQGHSLFIESLGPNYCMARCLCGWDCTSRLGSDCYQQAQKDCTYHKKYVGIEEL